MRLFVGVDIPEKRKIWEILRPLVKDERGVKWVKEDGLHVTLKFLGEVSQDILPIIKSALKESVQGISPFSLKVTGISAFPSLASPRVIWLGLGGDTESLKKLQERVEEELSEISPKEPREFIPHITICRIKDPVKGRKIGETVRGIKVEYEFLAESLKLFLSILKPEGAFYEVLEEFAFTV